jgi:hypothetical protein
VRTSRSGRRAVPVAAALLLALAVPALASAAVSPSPSGTSTATPSEAGPTKPTASRTPTRPSSPAPSGTVTAEPGAATAVPVWAYFYIWYDPSTWDRAKSDNPLLGTYSSDERAVMRQQIDLAKSAGIDGFLVSWKDNPKLSDRLSRLVEIAREKDFHLGIVYQGLDFARRPIETRQVCADLQTFATEYGKDPVFRLRGDKPVLIWTGTDQYSSADQRKCVDPVRDRLTVLASSRSVEEWKRASAVFAGSAYYWSSVNPTKEWYPRKLAEMGDAVHASGGLWVAPAAPGFDARLVGGETVVPRNGNQTLVRELDAALATAPDAIGLISWNEYSENSQVEPSKKYGTTALETLRTYTGSTAEVPRLDSSAPAADQPAASGFNGVVALLIMSAVVGAILVWSRWRRDPVAASDDHGPRPAGHEYRSARHGNGSTPHDPRGDDDEDGRS